MHQGDAAVYQHGYKLHQEDERVEAEEEEGQGLFGNLVLLVDGYLEGVQEDYPHDVDE